MQILLVFSGLWLGACDGDEGRGLIDRTVTYETARWAMPRVAADGELVWLLWNEPYRTGNVVLLTRGGRELSGPGALTSALPFSWQRSQIRARGSRLVVDEVQATPTTLETRVFEWSGEDLASRVVSFEGLTYDDQPVTALSVAGPIAGGWLFGLGGYHVFHQLPYVDSRYAILDASLEAVVSHDFYEDTVPLPFIGRYAADGAIWSFRWNPDAPPPSTVVLRGQEWLDPLPVDEWHLARATDGLVGWSFDEETGALAVHRWDGQRTDVDLPPGWMRELLSTSDGGGWVAITEDADEATTLFRYDADGEVVDAWSLESDGTNTNPEIASLGGSRAAVAWKPGEDFVSLRIVEARR